MPGRKFQFGAFEVDESLGELRKHGVKIRIQEQPFQILVVLLERPGEIVGREEIRARLWPENTFVDFDNAISSAVRKLREALNDSADNPRFIETSTRRGYRFIGQITAPPQLPAKPVPKRIKSFAIAAGALLLVVLAVWWLLSRPKPNTTPLTPVPLTAAHGWEAYPSFSPDGNQVAYSWADTETIDPHKLHIYVKSIGPGMPVRLTASPNPDVFPAWSPDGRRIAFIRGFGQSSAIYLISPVGGSERRLADGVFYGPAYWSPDSRFLAFGDRTTPNGIPSIYLLNIENGERLRLTMPPDEKTMDQGAVFSPDGKTLLFTRCTEVSTCALYLLDLSIGYRPRAAPRLLRAETGDIRGVAWTQDGKQIVYVLSDYGNANFHLMRIQVRSGALPERLLYAGDQLWMGVAIAPHGNRLAYAKNLLDQDIWQIQLGTPPRNFVASNRIESLPQYSPDGRQVAFSSDRSGQMEIWVCDSQGANSVQLTTFEEYSGSPKWSPDGRSIAFDRHLKQGWRIFVMAADGGQVRQLNTDSGDEVVPNWSRDGNWIYYAADRTGRYEIWKASAKGGKGVQITRNGGWAASESPDGSTLYYTKNLDYRDAFSDLWALPIDGGEERMVLPSVGSREFKVLEAGVYYVQPPAAAGAGAIRFYDFATGKSQEIASIKDFAGGLTISPDRTTFLFSVTRRSEANVMIVDNFR